MIAIYADAGQARPSTLDCLSRWRTRIGWDGDLHQVNMVVKFEMTDPTIDMWVDGRKTPVRDHVRPQNLKPNLTLKMTGETLHEILLGTLPLSKAIRSKAQGERINVQGDETRRSIPRLPGILSGDRQGDVGK